MQCARGTFGSVGRVCGGTCRIDELQPRRPSEDTNEVQKVVRALVGSFRHGSCGIGWVGGQWSDSDFSSRVLSQQRGRRQPLSREGPALASRLLGRSGS